MRTDIELLKKYKSITIFGMKYTFSFLSSEEMKDDHMTVSYENKKIRISNELTYPAETLFHELIHAVWEQTEMDNAIKYKRSGSREEIICNQIGLGVFLFVKDNIKFLNELFGSSKGKTK